MNIIAHHVIILRYKMLVADGVTYIRHNILFDMETMIEFVTPLQGLGCRGLLLTQACDLGQDVSAFQANANEHHHTSRYNITIQNVGR